jgi:hypothetical protein
LLGIMLSLTLILTAISGTVAYFSPYAMLNHRRAREMTLDRHTSKILLDRYTSDSDRWLVISAVMLSTKSPGSVLMEQGSSSLLFFMAIIEVCVGNSYGSTFEFVVWIQQFVRDLSSAAFNPLTDVVHLFPECLRATWSFHDRTHSS